ncbi:MAG: MFS transporter [Jatrophihabitans sp.]|uniref:MFS transporter n=1 Tax=Jatrophihabitans sp. TaxID=1932789 RepID=UPI0039154A5C
MADPRATRGLLAACLTATLMPLNSTMIAVALPSIAHAFHHSSAGVTQAVVASYLVAAIALQSVGGKLGDRLGHWQVVSVGRAVLALGALLGYLAPNLILLACSRVIMAAGGAVVVPATMALVRVEVAEERRGRAFGAIGATMSLAAGLGPLIGGELVSLFGWRSVFMANLPVLVAAAVLAGPRRRNAPSGGRRGAPFDAVGAVLLTGALVALIAGLQAKGAAEVVLVATGLLLFVPFASWERRAADPIVAFGLFRSTRYSAGSLVVALLNLVMYALLFAIPLVTHALFRLSSEATGRLLIFMMLAMVVASLIAGRLVDALGARPVGLVGTASSLAGATLLLMHDPSAPGDFRLPLALLGFGLGLATPAGQAASFAGVPADRIGMAAGLASSMRYLGGVAGVAILGRTLQLNGSQHSVLAAQHTMLALFVGVLVVSVGCSALLGGRLPAEEPTNEVVVKKAG